MVIRFFALFSAALVLAATPSCHRGTEPQLHHVLGGFGFSVPPGWQKRSTGEDETAPKFQSAVGKDGGFYGLHTSVIARANAGGSAATVSVAAHRPEPGSAIADALRSHASIDALVTDASVEHITHVPASERSAYRPVSVAGLSCSRGPTSGSLPGGALSVAGEQVLCIRGNMLFRAEYSADAADSAALQQAMAAFEAVVKTLKLDPEK